MASGILDDRPGDYVVRLRMRHHQRCETAIVTRGRLIHPRDRSGGIVAEAFGHRRAQRRRARAAIQRPHRMAHRTETQRGTATLVRYREAIAPDPKGLAVDAHQSDAPRADDQDRAIGTAVRPQVRNLRITFEDRGGEGKGEPLQRRAHAGAGNPGHAHRRAGPGHIRRGETGLPHHTIGHVAQRRMQCDQPQPGIGRPGLRLGQHPTVRIDQTAAAMTAASVHAQEKTRHSGPPLLRLHLFQRRAEAAVQPVGDFARGRMVDGTIARAQFGMARPQIIEPRILQRQDVPAQRRGEIGPQHRCRRRQKRLTVGIIVSLAIACRQRQRRDA
ncbi:hypothetical protein WR25_05293 [Diploscapter pachys]|uniref:Uncharacterized protein n=1 Tax=Diploscapter pachys TaxID=2018661 RepID=A0A2A2KB87_9BILA|nr:hypothetical protein WR25_05293 [Diploscapter pachys]